MSTIHYKFADGHTEELEVTEAVAAAFEQLEKYEKKVERKETRRHVSYERLIESGFEFSDENEDIVDTLERQERENAEWQEELVEYCKAHSLTIDDTAAEQFVHYKSEQLEAAMESGEA